MRQGGLARVPVADHNRGFAVNTISTIQAAEQNLNCEVRLRNNSVSQNPHDSEVSTEVSVAFVDEG